jgi:hypothetical protein
MLFNLRTFFRPCLVSATDFAVRMVIAVDSHGLANSVVLRQSLIPMRCNECERLRSHLGGDRDQGLESDRFRALGKDKKKWERTSGDLDPGLRQMFKNDLALDRDTGIYSVLFRTETV